MFMHHIVHCIDCVYSLFAGVVPPLDRLYSGRCPEYLSEEQCFFVDLSGKQPPLSISINPTLSFVLLILH